MSVCFVSKMEWWGDLILVLVLMCNFAGRKCWASFTLTIYVTINFGLLFCDGIGFGIIFSVGCYWKIIFLEVLWVSILLARIFTGYVALTQRIWSCYYKLYVIHVQHQIIYIVLYIIIGFVNVYVNYLNPFSWDFDTFNWYPSIDICEKWTFKTMIEVDVLQKNL